MFIRPERPVSLVLACLAVTGLAGCAGGGALSQGYAPSAGPPSETASITQLATADTYQLAPEEAELECKKLAGLVQLRLLEVRSGLRPEQSSDISRTLQSASVMFGGPTHGLDAAAEQRRQIAQLVAYNKALADKKCRSFDLAKALTSTETVPSPTVAASVGVAQASVASKSTR